MYQISFKINGKFFNSDVFDTQSEVEEMYQTIIQSDFNEEVIITELTTRRTYYGFIDETTADTDECDESIDLTGRFFKKYGKGYMLYPIGKKDIYYGEQYFMNGWWNDLEKGWFFKRQFYTDLIEYGAELDIAKKSKVKSTHSKGWTEWTDTDTTHIKKEIIDEDEEDSDYVPEDVHDEPAEEFDSDEDEDEVEEDTDMSNMVFMKYGKGYILKTHKKDSRYGASYFMDGFWNDKAKGWFFKKEFKKTMKQNGATYLKLTT
jgi:hypothetical protein